jgi:hypothetical protein
MFIRAHTIALVASVLILASIARGQHIPVNGYNAQRPGGTTPAGSTLDSVCIATQQAGTDAGAQIAACEALLPPSGGVVDATGLTGTQILSTLTVRAGIVLRLGAATYSVLTPINLTNLGPLGASIIGEGSTGGSLTATNGTVLIGNTGGGNPVLDLTGTGNFDLEHVTIQQGSSNPSTIGILEARSAATHYTEWHKLHDVHILFNSGPGANSGHGTIGIYNYGAEIASYDGITVMADKPLVLTSTNLYGVAAPSVAFYNTGVTMSAVTVTGDSDFYSSTSQAVTLNGTAAITLDQVYLAGNGHAGVYAVWAGGMNYGDHITGNVEAYDRALYVGGQFIYSALDVICASCGQVSGESSILLDGTMGESAAGSVTASTLRVYYAPTVATDFLESTGSVSGSTGWTIYMPPLSNIAWTGSPLFGTIYEAEEDNSTVSADVGGEVIDNHGVRFSTINPSMPTRLGNGPGGLYVSNQNFAATTPSYLANTGNCAFGWNGTGGNGEGDFACNRGTGSAGGIAFYDVNNSGASIRLLYANTSGTMFDEPISAPAGSTVDGKAICLADGTHCGVAFGAPSSSSAQCTQGQIAFDTAYLYTCVAANTWRRAPTASF